MTPNAYQWIAYWTTAAFPGSDTMVAETKLEANVAASITNTLTTDRLTYGNLPDCLAGAYSCCGYACACATGMRVTIGIVGASSAA